MIVTGRHLPRRTFLKGLGAAVALPMLDAMTPAFAGPAAPNTTGVRFFGTNENQTLYEDADTAPSAVTFNATSRAATNGTVVK